MSFQFGNVVVVDDSQIGVIVKSWEGRVYEVYVRSFNGIKMFETSKIKHYVYSKELTDEEKEFYI